MAVACGVKTSLTRDLNSSIIWSVTSPPFSLASDFCREPRWSIAAAAITPRSLDTFLSPASLPGVSFMRVLLGVRMDECLERIIVNQGKGNTASGSPLKSSGRYERRGSLSRGQADGLSASSTTSAPCKLLLINGLESSSCESVQAGHSKCPSLHPDSGRCSEKDWWPTLTGRW